MKLWSLEGHSEKLSWKAEGHRETGKFVWGGVMCSHLHLENCHGCNEENK